MNIAARGLVGLMGLFFLSMGLGFWFSLDDRAAQFAIEASSALGRASIRADFGSFFLTVGILCGYASWKRCGAAAAGAALLFVLALLGRIVTIILEGQAPGAIPPMVVEAVSVGILLWARNVWAAAK